MYVSLQKFRRGQEHLSTKKVMELMKTQQLPGSDKALVMEACDMALVPLFTSRSELGTVLGVRFSDIQPVLPQLVEADMFAPTSK